MTNRILLALDATEGFYSDLALSADVAANRYTAFVNYTTDGFTETEEVDVEAATVTHAREVTVAALTRDYLPGGKIVHIEERGVVSL